MAHSKGSSSAAAPSGCALRRRQVKKLGGVSEHFVIAKSAAGLPAKLDVLDHGRILNNCAVGGNVGKAELLGICCAPAQYVTHEKVARCGVLREQTMKSSLAVQCAMESTPMLTQQVRASHPHVGALARQEVVKVIEADHPVAAGNIPAHSLISCHINCITDPAPDICQCEQPASKYEKVLTRIPTAVTSA